MLLYFQPCLCPAEVRTKLRECLVEPMYFDEIAMSFTRMQTECRDFMSSFKQEGFPLEDVLSGFVISNIINYFMLTIIMIIIRHRYVDHLYPVVCRVPTAPGKP